MIRNTVSVRASRDGLLSVLTRVPSAARSGGPIADAMMKRVGLAVLGRIKTAFVVKARGGTDEAGDRWTPLSPKTIAYRKTRSRGRGGRTRAERKRPTHPSQALNTKQQARWWEVYRRQLAIYKGDKGHAAAVAWIILKREGAVTLLDKYGNRQVEILRDSGLLLNSLSPGYGGGEQVFRVLPGECIIGTNRLGAADHHRGDLNRNLPQRRLWPEPRRWPASWWQDVTDQVKQGVLDLIVSLVKRGV